MVSRSYVLFWGEPSKRVCSTRAGYRVFTENCCHYLRLASRSRDGKDLLKRGASLVPDLERTNLGKQVPYGREGELKKANFLNVRYRTKASRDVQGRLVLSCGCRGDGQNGWKEPRGLEQNLSIQTTGPQENCAPARGPEFLSRPRSTYFFVTRDLPYASLLSSSMGLLGGSVVRVMASSVTPVVGRRRYNHNCTAVFEQKKWRNERKCVWFRLRALANDAQTQTTGASARAFFYR
jgi:hypothetical protein